MDVPIGIDTMTCTGSGKSGPRTITLGLIWSIRILIQPVVFSAFESIQDDL
jgi:hypothetical protein